MKGLIINHGTKYIDNVIELFDNECDVVHHTNFDAVEAEKYDFIVLSGGPTIDENFDYIKDEKDWLLKTEKPILGICLGIQILCSVYGEDMKRFEKNRKLFENFKFVDTEYKMFYNHSYYFDKIPKDFIGEVNNGMVVWMKHKIKPVLAFQGHPEMTENGNRIKEFFLNKIVK